MRKRDWLLTLAAILGLTLTIPVQGCGLKADPAPGRIQPLSPLIDLRVQQEAGGIFIQWRMPEQPRAMTRFKLIRSEVGTDGASCPGCPPDEARIADLAIGEAKLVMVEAGIFGYLDTDVKPDRLYRYRVIGCDRTGSCSEPSASAALSVPVAP
ncbi:MAG: hypothetical protein V1766_00365 [Pseudomonadota bacterium]